MISRIIWVHDGAANYPSMIAAKKHFARLGYRIEDCREDEIMSRNPGADTILWYMMGYYPKHPGVSVGGIVHEYRSRSVGRGGWLKDTIKKHRNFAPGLRLFQDETILARFDRKDGIGTGILGLGVPDNIADFRSDAVNQGEFVYVGAISRERRIEQMIEAFRNAYSGGAETLVLIGKYEQDLLDEYRSAQILFTGPLPQEDVFARVARAEYAVSYFPGHPPHRYQIPTKLLEYAALGKKIIANDSPGNRRIIDDYRLSAWIMTDAFPSRDALRTLDAAASFDARELFWSNLIAKSGVERFVGAA